VNNDNSKQYTQSMASCPSKTTFTVELILLFHLLCNMSSRETIQKY